MAHRFESCLSFMDLLDVDESVVDKRLDNLMSRDSFTPDHLQRAALLLNYKLLLNSYEESDGDYNAEVNFAVRLLSHDDEYAVEHVCQIVKTTLMLNKNTLESRAQHILQQILYDLDLRSVSKINSIDNKRMLFKLKVIDSVLNAAFVCNIKIFLLLNDTPLENILYCEESEVRNHFVTETLTKLIQSVEGMNILDSIWNSISACDVTLEKKALVALSSLAEYYLPMPDENGTLKFESVVIRKRTFWTMVLRGLKSTDGFDRRCSLYLAKRAIDCIAREGKDVELFTRKDREPLFVWYARKADAYKTAWQSLFLLLEILEEKQSNIVRAGLALFQEISSLGKHWRNCAFELALTHPNSSVVQKSIEYRLKDGLTSSDEAKILLEAINTINNFDESSQSLHIMRSLREFCSDADRFKHILKSFPEVKWHPVPMFRLTEMFANLKLDNLREVLGDREITDALLQILQKSCNIPIVAEAVCSNIVHFVIRNCRCIDIKMFIEIIGNVKFVKGGTLLSLPIAQDISLFIKEYSKPNQELTKEQWKEISELESTIDLLLAYLSCHPNELPNYCEIIQERIAKTRDVNDRPYATRSDCNKHFFYICTLAEKILPQSPNSYLFCGMDSLVDLIEGNSDCLLTYLKNSIAIDNFRADYAKRYANSCQVLFSQYYCKNGSQIAEFFKFCRCHRFSGSNGTSFEIMNAIECVSANALFEMLICSRISAILSKIKGDKREEGEVIPAELGKLKNVLNEISCEAIAETVSPEEDLPLEKITEFIYEMLDTGNERCFLSVLKIYNKILPTICEDISKEAKCSMTLAPSIFLARAWKEIKEIRSNAMCKPSTKQFVAILMQVMQKCILMEPMYSDLILHYCTEILEYGSVSNVPLYYLTNEMDHLGNACNYQPLTSILADVLLFGKGSCKDHRITDSTVKYIKNNSSMFFAVDVSEAYFYFDSEIRNKAVKILLQPATATAIGSIYLNILDRVSEVFRNKTRYHGNSHPHRLLFRAIQHALLMAIVYPQHIDLDRTAATYILLLEKLPHQPSVRFCIEIFVAYVILVQNYKLDNATLDELRLRMIPLPSLFMIMNLVMKHKLKKDLQSKTHEYTFVMDSLLSHTMGQNFNVRLNAQYFAAQLYKMGGILSEKYEKINKVIEHTFRESKTEKNLIKLQKCYFANEFDVIENLTPECVYNFIPKYTQMDSDEVMDCEDIPTIGDCKNCINSSDNVNKEKCQVWMNAETSNPRMNELEPDLVKTEMESEPVDVSTIQKKYVPWNHMLHGEEACIINVQKNVKASGLIVVASLVDKRPNLGGLARTSEVFGVKKYIIDNLKHIEDKNFQGLSVSAEKWVEIEEVKPGVQLKEYLQRMKSEGYTIVAAEQTSSSVPLQGFKFPHNTVLLLGHEKEGVPCDLLPYMDHCVEIPQRGCVRSLNVHVTAAIFVWEYMRQNLL